MAVILRYFNDSAAWGAHYIKVVEDRHALSVTTV